MANVAYDINSQDQQASTTDVFSPQSGQNNQNNQDNSTQPTADTGSYSYVSNGNPYGSYAQPSTTLGPSQQTQQGSPSASRKQDKSASSGSFVNSQTYADKNKESIDKLNQSVGKGLQNTSDLVKQNTQNLNKQFQNQVDAGSLENWETAVDRSKQAFQEASQSSAPTKQFINSEATRYNPEKDEQGNYSKEDQSLVNSNLARVVFGDGTTKDYETESEAQTAIDDWNRLNKGVNAYGNEQQLSLSDKELADILNAQYQGPTDLYQTQGYADLYNQVNEAQNKLDLAQSNEFKGTLLKDLFGGSGDYSLGAQRLDDILFGRGESGDQLRSDLKSLGNLQDQFRDNSLDMRQTALGRDEAMQQIRKDSRSALDETALGREQEIENRLSAVIQDWEKYPDYFRNAIKQELSNHDKLTKQKTNYDKDLANYNTLEKSLKDAQTKLAVAQLNLKQGGKSLLSGPYDGSASKASLNKKVRDAQAEIDSLTKSLTQAKNKINSYSKEVKNFNPNSFNLNLSELEAEMLGIKGGEGLYDLIRKGGIDSIIKTAEADKNRLISQDEQYQLARLQQIAELAEGYGSADSGINYRNIYTDRDAAGTQSAIDALDLEYLRDQLQGREAKFRKDAKGTTITGKGTGKGSSGGAFGKSTKKVTKYLDQNMNELIKDAGGYRNIYSNEGISDDRLNQILEAAKGINSGEFLEGQDYGLNQLSPVTESSGNSLYKDQSPENILNKLLTDPSHIGSVGDIVSSGLDKALGNKTIASDIAKLVSGSTISSLLGKSGSDVVKAISSGLTGNSSSAKKKATKKAYAAAEKDLKNKIEDWTKSQGVGNQFNVNKDNKADLELLKLLGLLDTTNA